MRPIWEKLAFLTMAILLASILTYISLWPKPKPEPEEIKIIYLYDGNHTITLEPRETTTPINITKLFFKQTLVIREDEIIERIDEKINPDIIASKYLENWYMMFSSDTLTLTIETNIPATIYAYIGEKSVPIYGKSTITLYPGSKLEFANPNDFPLNVTMRIHDTQSYIIMEETT